MDRKTGRPIYNAIVWQCRRTADFCKKIKKKEKFILKKTGLVVDPYFSASKIRWILKQSKTSLKKSLAAGTIDTFLLWKLTQGQSHITDVSNASRTQLMDIEKRKWDSDLLKIFSIPKNILPELAPSSGFFGKTKGLSCLPDGSPLQV